jgi:hypothetical protein
MHACNYILKATLIEYVDIHTYIHAYTKLYIPATYNELLPRLMFLQLLYNILLQCNADTCHERRARGDAIGVKRDV